MVRMRRVELPGSELRLSRLGFGTAGLMARLGRRESVRLVEIAHDSGITHFDTARAYGYGEAESALGDFLAGWAASPVLPAGVLSIPTGRAGSARW